MSQANDATLNPRAVRTRRLVPGKATWTSWARRTPWLAAIVLLAVAVVLPFSSTKEEIDIEFPDVDRVVFSAYSPMVYRLAEPGDTLDRVAVYLSAVGVVASGVGFARSRRRRWLSGVVD